MTRRVVVVGSKEERLRDPDDSGLLRVSVTVMDCWHTSVMMGIILLYARLGLHRYNFLQGKNLQLRRVKKYNKTFGPTASTFYVTLVAEDPDIPSSPQIFQTKVAEHNYGKLKLNCSIARPLGETKEDEINKRSLFGETFGGKLLSQLMPEFPPENPFKNSKQFYVLKKPELQAHDWIRLYLELAVATTNRSSEDHELSKLKIMLVSIETTQHREIPNQGHNVYDATFYIRYKDYCEARVGKDVDRVAVIRRILDKNTGDLRLVGRTESSVTIIPKKARKNRFRPLLSVRKPWPLSSLRRHKSYKNCVLGSARRLHKTISI